MHPPMAIEESTFFVPSRPDQRLFLRRKRQAGRAVAAPVLMVHGSTLPGSIAFDLPLDGRSWMDELAGSCGDAWSVDLRGYGRSSKPPVEWRPDGRQKPVVRTADAIEDVLTAMQFICRQTGCGQIDLLGWSWGATIVGAIASKAPPALRRSVMHAPQWIRKTPSRMVTAEALFNSYRSVSFNVISERWLAGVEPQQREEIRRLGWAKVLRSAFPTSGVIDVPNGTIADIAEYWAAGRSYYDPATIATPLLIVVGERDAETPPDQAEAIADRVPAGLAGLEIVPGGTHFACMEPARVDLFHRVSSFLQC